jgi:sulfoxide reductase heme-binding subunit YedZ
MPWLDPAGRFSAFKLAVFLLLFVPAILIAYRFASGALGARPLNEAVHQIGNWTLRLILVSLAVTPGRRILGWPRLMQVRRMVGVAAFAYAAAHLALYAADENFVMRKVAFEIVLRIYLAIGFVALLILAALAITSTDGMIRRLGGRNWRRLHRLVYVAALLSVIHFFMQAKFNVAECWVMAGLFGWLMACRAPPPPAFRQPLRAAWWPAILALLAGLATATGEAIYYWIKLGVPPLRVLEAQFMFTPSVRPAWIALAICLAAAIAGIARHASFMLRQPARAARPH